MGQRCTAKAKSTGNRCQKTAIPGGTVCYFHGGEAPQTLRKAAERLADARNLLLRTLVGLTEDGEVDARTALDGVDRLTKLVELLEGRATGRGEVLTVDAIDAEIRRIEEEMAG